MNFLLFPNFATIIQTVTKKFVNETDFEYEEKIKVLSMH